ncbi:hypothetical protein [Actinomadura sp. 9N215]|uniref:hypothetical protein n=1 Tax=Actinomadura sp. 9N215 TaxID=3375150 RepID=UPI0037BB0875
MRRSAKRKKTFTGHPAWTHENVYIVTSRPHGDAQADRVARTVRSTGDARSSTGSATSCSASAHAARTSNGPINLAILRNTALTRRDTNGTRVGAKTLRARTRKPERALPALAS